jgi:phosphomethylpyrimidine synthase
MGIMEEAISGRITEEMKIVADNEGETPEFIRRGIAVSRIVIPTSPTDIRDL